MSVLTPPTDARSGRGRGMRFAVDAWDPGYGSSLELEDDLGVSTAKVVTDVEVPDAAWAPIPPNPNRTPPSAILFVDGVRRIEARIWIDDAAAGPLADEAAGTADEATLALCASYAAGTVCCCSSGAHLLSALPRRGMFTIVPNAVDVHTRVGTYVAHRSSAESPHGLAVALSAALQRRLADLEVLAAVEARTSLAQHGIADGDDLLVIDGPLRGRQHLPRALGFIKSHRTSYLPPPLHAMVGRLGPAERTPVFLMGTSWDRHAWYLRLPCPPAAPWAGVVRMECSADMPASDAVALAGLSQAVLPRFASTEYKDARAPQNLYPIGGLERELRRRLGDPTLLYRALRESAASVPART